MCLLWFLQDKVATESLPLQCFTVKLTERPEGEESNTFHLYHKKTLYYTFRADDPQTARRFAFICAFIIFLKGQSSQWETVWYEVIRCCILGTTAEVMTSELWCESSSTNTGPFGSYNACSSVYPRDPPHVSCVSDGSMPWRRPRFCSAQSAKWSRPAACDC